MTLLERLQKDIKAPFEFIVIGVGRDYSDEITTVYLNVPNDVFDTYKDREVCEHCGALKEKHPPQPPPARNVKGVKNVIDKSKLRKLISGYADAVKRSSCLRGKRNRFNRRKAAIELDSYIDSLE